MTDNGAVEDNDDWKVPSDDNDDVDDDYDDVDDVNVDVNTDVYVLVQIKPGFWFLLCAGVFVGLRTQDLLAYQLVCTMVYALRVCLGTYLRYSSIRNIHKVCEK